MLDGTRADGLDDVDVVVRAALAATAVDVLAADGFLLGTPANIGYLSGAMKHFFDQVYYPCLSAKVGAPYGLYVHGNLDTTGAVRAAESITKGNGVAAGARAGARVRRADQGRPRSVLGPRRDRGRHPRQLSAEGRVPIEPSPADDARLARRLGTGDAVVIGLGSMIGAGVFAAFGPAARAAGAGLLIGLGIAAVIAYCNAVASAQLAAVYPTSGGTYIYGRERLGDWWGFAAGWAFVIGKTASCAAMALTFASYAVPGPWWAQRLVGVAAVLALAGLNYRGVTKTAALTRVLVAATLGALAVVVIGIWTGGRARAANLDGWTSLSAGGVHGILQAAGLLFFAFAGYARIATMGEEVRDPQRTIPRAIPAALAITVAVYAVVAVSALSAGGPGVLAHASSPLTAAVQAAGAGGVAPVVRIGGAVASLGALLALIAGVGRTTSGHGPQR